MPTTLTVRDETLGGEPLNEFVLELLTERITVRELIRSRVYQEVQDHNLRDREVFRGFVQPTDSERALNGWKLKDARSIDWKRQFELAVEAFEKNQVLILIDDRQAESLDEEITVAPETRVSFLRLTPLVGG
jgi:hypothetical protein